MELRTAESKSLIRRKTVKVNTGAGSRSRRSPALQAQLFLRSISLFQSIFSRFFAFLNERCVHTVAAKSTRAIMLSFILPISAQFCHFTRVRAAHRTVFPYLLRSYVSATYGDTKQSFGG